VIRLVLWVQKVRGIPEGQTVPVILDFQVNRQDHLVQVDRTDLADQAAPEVQMLQVYLKGQETLLGRSVLVVLELRQDLKLLRIQLVPMVPEGPVVPAVQMVLWVRQDLHFRLNRFLL